MGVSPPKRLTGLVSQRRNHQKPPRHWSLGTSYQTQHFQRTERHPRRVDSRPAVLIMRPYRQLRRALIRSLDVPRQHRPYRRPANFLVCDEAECVRDFAEVVGGKNRETPEEERAAMLLEELA